MDFEQSVDYIMEAILEEYPGKFQITDPRAKMWRQMLHGFTCDIIMAAGYQVISTTDDQWPPTIGMIRTKCVQFSHGELTAPTGHEAWEKILKKFQYEAYPLTDLEAAALAQVGSIYDLKRSKNTMVDRANFVKAFEHLVAKQQIERATLPDVKALVKNNVPLLLPDAGDSARKTSEKQLPLDTDAKQLPDGDPHGDDGGGRVPPEEIRAFISDMSKKMKARDQGEAEDAAERKAIQKENEQ